MAGLAEAGVDQVSAMDVSGDGATLVLGTPEGEGAVVDVRAGALVAARLPLADKCVALTGHWRGGVS